LCYKANFGFYTQLNGPPLLAEAAYA
jgi:hypothetical protein